MTATTTISRRAILTLLAGTGAAALAGCEPTRALTSTPAATIPDVLLVEVGDGLGVLCGADRR
jgi:hypothetical protein